MLCNYLIVKLEGVAYRGRVLLELETSLDGLPEHKKEPISDTHIRRLQV